IGDFRAENKSHSATDAALHHAAQVLGVSAEVSWLPTDTLRSPQAILDTFDGLLCAPGSPYANMDHALAAIRYARENNRVFLGTCGGFQHAIIEFARNVLGIRDAEHEETAPGAPRLFLSRLSCSLIDKSGPIRIRAGTQLRTIYGQAASIESFWCNFGVNPEYSRRLESGGLKISATDDEGGVRAVELPDLRFFLGTLFIPQLTSSLVKPHPVIQAFLSAAADVPYRSNGGEETRTTRVQR
ncbi:MAG TPA: CTP synthase, partial [Candidatus Nitrosotalea sp.]|nr:CTP synthase [Candidatus Nitrosotalea sp.]